MSAPRATVRLQFHRGFTFERAAALVDYFAALGISHVYASPITTAEPGSTHGYDTVDYTRVNPELGGEEGLARLVGALRAKRMGLIVDIVPNHMGVGGAHNRWWLDLLAWGRHSTYAHYFDVDWGTPDAALRNKVLAPFLGAPYGIELQEGKLALSFDAASGEFYVAYYDNRFPICPADYATILEAPGTGASGADSVLGRLIAHFRQFGARSGSARANPRDDREHAAAGQALLREAAGSNDGQAALTAALEVYAPQQATGRERLHRLLEHQHYRLAWWRTASDEINWRRFFDIATLAGMRVECPDVFEASHALIFRLYAQGLIDGVRVDHVDGLAAPREYCQRLRQRLNQLVLQRPEPLRAAPYLVVEKILARGEPMRGDWCVDGTTGYDFMNDVGALLHDPAGCEPLTRVWTELTGRPPEFGVEARQARRKLLAENLGAEFERTARALHRMARARLSTRDYSLAAIRRVLIELVVHYPVYRIYPLHGTRSLEDEIYFGHAREDARQALRAADHAVLAAIDDWLGGQPQRHAQEPARDTQAARRAALVLFSQLSAPTAAKAVEDTACYRYGRLLSRNEVGADPAEFALSLEAFHAANLARAQHFPRALLCTATHDHKRGEDMRARLAVLSEIGAAWSTTLRSWSNLNAPQRRTPQAGGDEAGAGAWAPGPDAEIMLYQTLVGAWPPQLSPDDESGVRAFAERVAQWQQKALREAKLRTSWFAPHEAYEQACREFLFDILAPQRREGFLSELSELAARIGPAGAVNSLQQTLLRLTSPGIPDLYQGTELWDFSLVDPDNRRPVDFDLRHRCLSDVPPSEHLVHWRDGRVKMGIIQRALALRAHAPTLFSDGAYLPLKVEGALADHVVAFARHHGHSFALSIASRHVAGLLGNEAHALPMVAPQAWADTAVLVPDALASRALFDWFSGAAPKSDGQRLLIREALGALPVALLVDEGVPPLL